MNQMTRQRFEELAGAFGHNLSKWPEAERDAASALLSRTPELQSVLRDAAELDDLLTGFMAETQTIVSPQKTARREVRSLRDLLGTIWPFGSIWQPAAGLVAASLAGFVLGMSGLDPLSNTDTAYNEQLTLIEYALGADATEYEQ